MNTCFQTSNLMKNACLGFQGILDEYLKYGFIFLKNNNTSS